MIKWFCKHNHHWWKHIYIDTGRKNHQWDHEIPIMLPARICRFCNRIQFTNIVDEWYDPNSPEQIETAKEYREGIK